MNEKARAKAFEKLHTWLLKEKESYNCGDMMSMAESVYGEKVIDSVVKKMEQLLSEVLLNVESEAMGDKKYEVVELLKQLSEKMHDEQKVDPDDVSVITSTLAAFMEKFYKAGCIGCDE